MIFTAYLAVSVNYAKAFKIKNSIISIIENNEGISSGAPKISDNIDNFLSSQGYKAYGTCEEINDNGDLSWKMIDVDIYPNGSGENGVCIYRKDVGKDNICQKSMYRVVTFFRFDIPYLGDLLTFRVQGNTKVIYDLANHPECIYEGNE